MVYPCFTFSPIEYPATGGFSFFYRVVVSVTSIYLVTPQ